MPKSNVHQKLEIEARRKRVVELYATGVSQAQVAEAIGVSVGTVNSDLQAVRQDWRAIAVDDLDAYVREQLDRLDEMLTGLQSGIKLGHTPSVMAAVAVLNRQAKLLGLDGPTKNEVAGPNGGPIQTMTWREALERATSDDDDAAE